MRRRLPFLLLGLIALAAPAWVGWQSRSQTSLDFLTDRAVTAAQVEDLGSQVETTMFLRLPREDVAEALGTRLGSRWQKEAFDNGNFSFRRGDSEIITVTLPTPRNPAPEGTKSIVRHVRSKLPFF